MAKKVIMNTQDVLANDGLFQRWIVDGGTSDPKLKDVMYMENCRKITTPLYLCNRPPGAAGALIVPRGGYVVYGWVAPPSGGTLFNCLTDGCEMVDGHCVRNLHAEVQAVCRAAANGIELNGATIYSLLKPCYNCSKIIIAAGITRIVYAGAAYDEKRTRELLENAGVICDYVDIKLGYGMEMS